MNQHAGSKEHKHTLTWHSRLLVFQRSIYYKRQLVAQKVGGFFARGRVSKLAFAYRWCKILQSLNGAAVTSFCTLFNRSNKAVEVKICCCICRKYVKSAAALKFYCGRLYLFSNLKQPCLQKFLHSWRSLCVKPSRSYRVCIRKCVFTTGAFSTQQLASTTQMFKSNTSWLVCKRQHSRVWP